MRTGRVLECAEGKEDKMRETTKWEAERGIVFGSLWDPATNFDSVGFAPNPSNSMLFCIWPQRPLVIFMPIGGEKEKQKYQWE